MTPTVTRKTLNDLMTKNQRSKGKWRCVLCDRLLDQTGNNLCQEHLQEAKDRGKNRPYEHWVNWAVRKLNDPAFQHEREETWRYECPSCEQVTDIPKGDYICAKCRWGV